MNPSIDVSISVLSFNTNKLLWRCIESIAQYTRGISYEVTVVDNGSHDGSVEMVKKEFPDVTLVANRENRWYSGGNNDGFLRARGRYIAFCNADTHLVDNAFLSIVRWLDRHPETVAIEPRKVGDDGHIEQTGSLLNRPMVDVIELTILNRWLSRLPSIYRFRQRNESREKSWKTEMVSGAFFVVRTEAARNVGGFDERLKLYYTDTDLCRKLLKIGQICHIGEIGVIHSVSQSTKQLSWWARSGIYARDALVYYWISGRKVGGIALWPLLQINRVLVQAKLMVLRT